MASMSTEPPFGRAGEDDSSGEDDGEEVMEVRRKDQRKKWRWVLVNNPHQEMEIVPQTGRDRGKEMR